MNFEESLSLFEEEIGKVVELDNYVFCIFSSEGIIPHIHFFKGDLRQPDLSGCLKLKSAEYFSHGGKYKSVLPRKVFKHFVDWISEDNNYKFVCSEWNKANGNNPIALINPEQINPYKKIT